MHSRISVFGEWTVEQREWLEHRSEQYLQAFEDEDLSFLPDLYHEFLTLWPVRCTLWPGVPHTIPLTKSQKRRIYKGEDVCKSVRAL